MYWGHWYLRRVKGIYQTALANQIWLNEWVYPQQRKGCQLSSMCIQRGDRWAGTGLGEGDLHTVAAIC